MPNRDHSTQKLFPAGTSVRTSLFVSYLCTLMLPILLSCIVFAGSYQVTSQQVNHTISMVDKHMAALVDTYLNEVRDESFALILSDYSQMLMNYTDSNPTPRQIQYLSELQKEMRFKIASSSYISSMYAVFPKSDVILSGSGVYYDHNFAHQCRSDLGMTLDEWDSFLDFDGYRRLFIFEDSDGSIRMLTAQKDRYTSSGRQPSMLFVMNLEVSTFQDILEGLSLDGSTLAMIYDTESGIALHSSQYPGDLSCYFEDGKLLPGTNTLLSSETVGSGAWICVILTPMKDYLASLTPLFLCTGVYLLMTFAGGIALSSYLSKRQSNPMQELSKRMLAAVKQTPLEKNEYRQVHQALTELLRQRSTMVEENELARKGLREHALRSILSGRVSKDSLIYRHAYNNGIRLDSGRFLVVIYDVEDFGKVFSGISTADSEGDEFLATVLDIVVYTVAQDSQKDIYCRYAVEIDGHIACLVCCPSYEPAHDVCQKVLRDTDLARSYLESNFSLILSAAVSPAHDGIENIQLCYQEALETLDYMETMSITAKSCLYSEIRQSPTERSPALTRMLEREQQLCNCVRAGEFQSAQQLLQGIVDDLILGSRSAVEARLRILGLITAIEPTFEEARTALDLEGLPGQESWFQTKDINAITAQVEHMLEELAFASAQQRSSSPSRQREQFLQYAANHLTDSNLNVAMAAESFDMSPSYFSRLFKKSIGVGFLDYVHQNRVRMAKEKMRAIPSLPLKDISEQVGYTTPLALNRAFRKYEGVPPSVFRKQI